MSRFSLWTIVVVSLVGIVVLIGAVTDTLVPIALFMAGLLCAFFLPFALLQLPRLQAKMAMSRVEVAKEPRAWARRITGIGAMAASPFYGFAFPLAAIPAAVAIFVKPLGGWPARTKSLVWSATIGLVVLVLSAQMQGQPVSGNILHYASFALFVIAGVKMTRGETSAAQLLGYASIGSAMFFVVFRPSNTDTFEHLWKYGLAPYVAIIVVWLLCSVSTRRALPLIALLVIGCASLFLGFRSHGLVCFLAFVFIMVQSDSISTRAGKAVRGFLAFAALYGLSKALPFAIEAGVFGEAVRARTMAQLGDGGPDLLAGRVEPPLSIAAILERPWFGWGNLNAIDNHTMSIGADIAYGFGMVPQEYMKLWVRSDGRVSVHSVLGEGWAEGGVLSAVLSILLLALFAAAIFKAKGNWAPLVILVSLQGIWDVLFSTWGYNRALTLALSAVLAAWAIARKPESSLAIAQADISSGLPKTGSSRPSLTRHR